MKHSKWFLWKRLKFLMLNVAVLIFLTGCQSASSSQDLTAAVVHIISGRDIEVAGVAAQPDVTERVRFEGIAVPDVSQQPWGEAAKVWLEQRLRNQTVRLETDVESRDAIGRRLAYIWQGNTLLNEALVAEGYALVTPHLPNSKYDQRLAHAQDRARILGLGIWNSEKPLRVSPADFRGQQVKGKG